MNPDTLVSVLIYGIPLWVALVIILFRWDGRKVVEPEPVEHSDGTPDYAAIRSSVERAAGMQP